MHVELSVLCVNVEISALLTTERYLEGHQDSDDGISHVKSNLELRSCPFLKTK